MATPVFRPLPKVPKLNTNSPLNCANKDTFTGPKEGFHCSNNYMHVCIHECDLSGRLQLTLAMVTVYTDSSDIPIWCGYTHITISYPLPMHSHDMREESYLGSSLLTVSVATYEVELWFHSWYRGRVETLDAKYNLIFR